MRPKINLVLGIGYTPKTQMSYMIENNFERLNSCPDSSETVSVVCVGQCDNYQIIVKINRDDCYVTIVLYGKTIYTRKIASYGQCRSINGNVQQYLQQFFEEFEEERKHPTWTKNEK